MTPERLLIRGFPWFCYPIRCHDVFAGLTPRFQDTDARLPHWTEYREGKTSACVLADFNVNGLIVVTREATQPALPNGWVCEDAALPSNWSVMDDGWTIRLASTMPLTGRTWCVFDAVREPIGETCDRPEESP
jgi:hypothetical protein